MSGYSGLDFSSVGGELAYWLTHVTQAYKGGFPGSGENGYDFGIPHGTPVYAILPGRVVGAGYYGGGGVVAVQYNPQNIVYYQHLDLNQVNVGDQIAVGQQLGLSGGQLSGGNHPATCCSGGDHIEVGLNAPFGGMWNPNNVTPNANPIGLFNSLNAQYKGADIATGGAGGKTGGYITGLVGGASTLAATGQPSESCLNIGPWQVCLPAGLYSWITQPVRILKIAAAGLLIMVATLLIAIPVAAPPLLKGAGVVTGQPTLVAAGSALGNRKKPGAGAQADQVAVSAAASRAQSNQLRKQAPPTRLLMVQAAPVTEPLRAPATKPTSAPGTFQWKPGLGWQQGVNRGIASLTPSGPAPQRAPGTGLTDTYNQGAKTVVSGTPIPDAEVFQTQEDIRQFYEFKQGKETTRQEREKRGKMTPEETRRALGLGPGGGGGKYPGTEETIESLQRELAQRERDLSGETEPDYRAAYQRDIASLKARIAKLQQKKGGS